MRYRVEVWIAAHDERGPYATIRAVTFCSEAGVLLFADACKILAQLSGDPRQLPRIADVVTLH